ncbi:protein OCTOPUS-like [Impatiens glandulifera]|uniref:protein OCTOPUS-like n=1 Tax=Impatiens glandulifera TaxID=253017 RepID=UPI001FB189EF|nr:protein OCTOPUS-like [Impatiens glandulifera]
MNPSDEQLLPPQQPHRLSFSCDRHPSEQYNGFCPTCLCERLSTLDNESPASSSSRRPSNAAAAAIKSIFRVSGRNKASAASSFLPELRRTKSFSASKNERFTGIVEPQRKSCDVRTRSTLWNLFNQEGERKFISKIDQPVEIISSVNVPVLESKEEEEQEEEQGEIEDDCDGDEIRVSEAVEEIVSIVQEEIKTMKDHIHIDLDLQTKKPSSSSMAGSFWAAASVFSKKWQKWRQKQKVKKRNLDVSSVALPVEKPISRQFHETQSEIADYGFGRRSCDTDPRFSLDAGRFSLDAGRMSFEDPRYSFDEPRASWDGHLIGRTFPRLPPMLSVVEDSPIIHVSRSDTEIPLEGLNQNYIKENERVPGGSIQTREYYDSSSRRRKSLDRSSSIRKTAASVVAELDQMKAGVDYREWDSEDEEKGMKKSKKWMKKGWNIWGLFIHRRNNNNKDEGRNGIGRSYSESWPEMRRGVGEGNRSLRRSRDSSYNLGSFGKKRGEMMMMMNNSGSRRG